MIRLFTSKTQQTGQIGEDKAVRFLMKQGYLILKRNLNNRHGEIDIVASKKKMHYFFEVKTGRQGSWFNPADNLTKEKLWKFFRAVEYEIIGQKWSKDKTAIKIKDYKIQGILVLLPEDDKMPPSIEIIDLS
jgi:putative endonuclease